MRNFLILGGTGILGSELQAEIAKHNDIRVFSISKEVSKQLPDAITQFAFDRKSPSFLSLLQMAFNGGHEWDCVIDLCAFCADDARVLVEALGSKTAHFITISTTLVYDRQRNVSGPLNEDVPLVPLGRYGGYVDGKVDLENFWQGKDNCNWTILRPYHILGRNSLLGCLPLHNRDPEILDRIRRGDCLTLVKEGHHLFSYVHPNDVARAILAVANFDISFGKAYNLVHCEPVSSRDYYFEIARQLGRDLEIKGISIRDVWNDRRGWEMTTLPHVYAHDKLFNEVGFSPSIKLPAAIKDAIDTYPTVVRPVNELEIHQRMNMLPPPIAPGWLLAPALVP